MPSTITFRPTEEQGDFIEALINTGDYANQTEIIRAGLRLLQENRASSKLEMLRRMIEEGEKSGEAVEFDVNEFLGRMRKKHHVS